MFVCLAHSLWHRVRCAAALLRAFAFLEDYPAVPGECARGIVPSRTATGSPQLTARVAAPRRTPARRAPSPRPARRHEEARPARRSSSAACGLPDADPGAGAAPGRSAARSQLAAVRARRAGIRLLAPPAAASTGIPGAGSAPRGRGRGSRGGSPGYPPCMAGEWLGTDVPLHAHHERPAGMGLHICAVVQRGSGSPSEYVEIVNDGAEAVPVTGLELTDCAGEQHEHVYTFPEGELDAGETAYIYSGERQGSAHTRRRPDPVCRPAASRLEGRHARRIPAPPGWQDHRHAARRAPTAPPRRPLASRAAHSPAAWPGPPL